MFEIGTIIAWRNADIPLGWVLCDGQNGTPDIRGRMPKGAANDGELKTTGGAATHTHTYPTNATSENGAHVHSVLHSWSNSGVSADKGPSGTNVFRAANHNHDAGFLVYSGGAHRHGIGQTGAASNLNRHIKLVFIMRLS
jgi:microcystin-dependent protein